jgi:hypothetical protein
VWLERIGQLKKLLTPSELEPAAFGLEAHYLNQLVGKALLNKQRHDKAVGIATGYGLDDLGVGIRVSA